jgi:hypothetical protein
MKEMLLGAHPRIVDGTIGCPIDPAVDFSNRLWHGSGLEDLVCHSRGLNGESLTGEGFGNK